MANSAKIIILQPITKDKHILYNHDYHSQVKAKERTGKHVIGDWSQTQISVFGSYYVLLSNKC